MGMSGSRGMSNRYPLYVKPTPRRLFAFDRLEGEFECCKRISSRIGLPKYFDSGASAEDPLTFPAASNMDDTTEDTNDSDNDLNIVASIKRDLSRTKGKLSKLPSAIIFSHHE